MKRILLMFLILLTACDMDINEAKKDTKRKASMINENNENKNANKINSEGYMERRTETGIEYSKEGIVYIFSEGALTTIEQLNWGSVGEQPLSWAYSYDNKPKEIIYTSESGDRSQSKIYIEITMEKTILNQKYNSKNGKHLKKHEAPTSLDVWIKLSNAFEWSEFSALKSGPSKKAHDGMDFTITVKTKSGTFAVTNYNGNESKVFFELISDYRHSLYEKTEETVVPR